MIPVSDVIPPRTRPVITTVLIGCQVAVFLVLQMLTPAQQEQVMHAAGLVPAEMSGLRVVTAMFVHAAWPPLVANLLYLWLFGVNVEDRLGRARFLAFYIVVGVAAAMAQSAMDPGAFTPLLGASGAVAGVLGGYLVLYPTSRVLMLVPLPLLLVEVPAFFLIGVWFVVQFGLSIQAAVASGAGVPGGAAFWAQTAACAGGAALVRVLQRPERARVEWWAP